MPVNLPLKASVTGISCVRFEVMADAVVASAGSVQNGGSPAQVSYNRNKIIATKGLSQIPNDQIILSNGVLKQNPGWAD